MKLSKFLETIQVQKQPVPNESLNNTAYQEMISLQDDLMSVVNTDKKLNIIGEMILTIARR